MTGSASAFVDWDAKLRAFLHDPPHKAVCLAQRVGHKEAAARLAQAAGVDGAKFDPRADHLASAADRPRGLEGAAVDWLAAPVVARPTGRKVDWAERELRATVGGLDARGLTDEIAEALGEFAPLEPRARFLAAWRLLPERLAARGQGRRQSEQIGPWWGVLPADTRVPDHGIWSHAGMVSAFAGALPAPALLEVRLGPVQAFIRASRRTRDLWAGSWLLAYLGAAAAWELSLAVGPDAVVFPDVRGQPLIDLWIGRTLRPQEIDASPLRGELSPEASLPNRVLALVPASTTEELGRAAFGAVRRKMVALVDAVRRRADAAATQVGAPVDDPGWGQHWKRAEGSFPEVSWVGIDLPGGDGGDGFEEILVRAEGWAGAWPGVPALISDLREAAQRGSYAPNLGLGYPAAYALLQAASDARRALRSFEAWEGVGERCTVCGDRPALPVADPGAGRTQQRAAWQRFASALRSVAGSVWVALDGREMTCGLCLVRRALPEVVPEVEEAPWQGGKLRFPSTGSVATARWRERVEEAALTHPALERALSGLEAVVGRADAAAEMALYPSGRPLARLDGRVLLAGGPERLEEEYGEAADALAGAAEALRGAARDLGSPPGYYAVLAMDGDRMGRWLSGAPEAQVRLAEVVHPSLASSIGGGGMAPIGPSRHAGISAVLRGFATLGAPGIVRQGRGAVVYAGGDDVLALLPVETVLEVARRLRVGFSEGGAGDGRDAWVPGDRDRPDRPPEGLDYWIGSGRITASAGIAVAHHLTDLRVAIEAALAMEERAKEEAGRDALGIAVLKRSGERREVLLPWFLTDAPLGTASEVVEAWRDAFAGGLSQRILRDLEDEAAASALGSEEALGRRLVFLLGRHGPKAQGATGHGASLAEGLLGVWRALQGRGWDPERAWGAEGCLGAVAVAAFLARGGRG